jgi:hypothetical protein
MLMNFRLFIRVASVNVKGLSLSNFYMINDQFSHSGLIPSINQFRCFSDDQNQFISLQWSINNQSDFNIEKYLLYYSDLTENNNDLIRILTIPISNNLLKYQLNTSLLKLNSNPYHLLRFHLVLIDQNHHQLPFMSLPIYSILSRKFGKNNRCFSF